MSGRDAFASNSSGRPDELGGGGGKNCAVRVTDFAFVESGGNHAKFLYAYIRRLKQCGGALRGPMGALMAQTDFEQLSEGAFCCRDPSVGNVSDQAASGKSPLIFLHLLGPRTMPPLCAEMIDRVHLASDAFVSERTRCITGSSKPERACISAQHESLLMTGMSFPDLLGSRPNDKLSLHRGATYPERSGAISDDGGRRPPECISGTTSNGCGQKGCVNNLVAVHARKG